jgi:hypothetical protein
MIVEFVDSVTGTPVYINPEIVMTLRPDPSNPTGVTQVKLRDGETFRVHGDHEKVAAKLSRAA